MAIKISAKLAQDGSEFDLSGLGVMAHAYGVLTGGMAGDYVIDLGNADITLVVSQLILLDGGDKRMVTGSCQSDDNESTFLSMADGTIEMLSVKVSDGVMSAESHEATGDDLDKCVAFQVARESISSVADAALAKSGMMQDGDETKGNIEMNTHEAIRNFLSAKVTLLIKRAGKIVHGFVVIFDHIQAQTDFDSAVRQVHVTPMDNKDIEYELKRHNEAIGNTNPFQPAIGIA